MCAATKKKKVLRVTKTMEKVTISNMLIANNYWDDTVLQWLIRSVASQ